MNLEKKQLWITVAGIVLVCGFVFGRYMPLRKQYNQIQREKMAKLGELNLLSGQSHQISPLRQQIADLSEKVGDFDAKIPVERKLGEFLEALTVLMEDHQLTEQQIEPGDVVQLETLRCIPIQMACEGTLQQLFGFYQSLQKLDRLMRIEQVNLTEAGDFSGRVQMKTQAVIYYRGDKDNG